MKNHGGTVCLHFNVWNKMGRTVVLHEWSIGGLIRVPKTSRHEWIGSSCRSWQDYHKPGWASSCTKIEATRKMVANLEIRKLTWLTGNCKTQTGDVLVSKDCWLTWDETLIGGLCERSREWIDYLLVDCGDIKCGGSHMKCYIHHKTVWRVCNLFGCHQPLIWVVP